MRSTLLIGGLIASRHSTCLPLCETLDTRLLLSAGSLDTTFGQGGVATANLPGPSSANEVFALPGGKTLAAGNTIAGFGLARYNANGSLDTSFGTSGKTVTPHLIDNSVQVLSSGKILVAGTTAAFPGGGLVMARYNSNGTLDKTFGKNGLVLGIPGLYESEAVTFSVLGNGSILVAGDESEEIGRFEYQGSVLLARLLPNGALDKTFGGGTGIIVGPTIPEAVDGSLEAIGPDGKLLAVAPGGFDLARYNANLTTDTTFNGGNQESVNFGLAFEYDVASTIALLPNGNVIVAGQANSQVGAQPAYFALAEFNPDGSADPGFGSHGKILTSFQHNSSSIVNAVAFLPGGKLLAVGKTTTSAGVSGLAVARYNANGSLDTTFGPSHTGQFSTSFAGGTESANAIALTSAGQYLVAGSLAAAPTRTSFGVARYNATGSLDTTFGASGHAVTDFPGNDVINAIVTEPDGQILAAGQNDNTFSLSRFNANGSLDTTFGGGSVRLADAYSAQALALLPGGKILVVGSQGVDDYYGGTYGFVLARFNSNGTLDPTFGGQNGAPPGVTIEDPGAGAQALAVLPDGKFLVAGTNGGPNGGGFTLIRYNANGTRDTTFGAAGDDGVVQSPDNLPLGNFSSLTVDSSGRILLAGSGYIFSSGNYGFCVARYSAVGVLDTTFGTGGFESVPVGAASYSTEANAITLLPGGKILVAGQADDSNGSTDFALVRLNADGSIDTTFGPLQNGTVTTDFGGFASASAVSVEANGDYLVAGTAGPPGPRLAVARYNPNGTLDTTFGPNHSGVVRTGVPGASSAIGNALEVLSDGQFIVAGTAFNGMNYEFALAQYQG